MRALTNSKAIILAAGEGSRLRPLTESRPKVLVRIGRRSILHRALWQLRFLGIDDISIVAGHKAELIRAAHRVIHNPHYLTSNNILSVALAIDDLDGHPFILLNGDLVFSTGILKGLASQQGNIVLAVDTLSSVDEESMKVVLTEGKVSAIGKDLSLEENSGEYIGMVKFGDSGSRIFFKAIRELIHEGHVGEFYETAFQKLIDEGTIVSYYDVGAEPWVEVDTHADLEEARMMARSI